jgi:DNA replication protein DnaC
MESDDGGGERLPMKTDEGRDGASLRRRRRPKILISSRISSVSDPVGYARSQCMLYLPWRQEDELDADPCTLFADNTTTITTNATQYCRLKPEEEMEQLVEQLRDIARAREEERELDLEEAFSGESQADTDGCQTSDDQSCANNFTQQPRPLKKRRLFEDNLAPQESAGNKANTEYLLSPEEFAMRLQRLNRKQRRFLHETVHRIKAGEEQVFSFLSGGAGVGKTEVTLLLFDALTRYVCLGRSLFCIYAKDGCRLICGWFASLHESQVLPSTSRHWSG